MFSPVSDRARQALRRQHHFWGSVPTGALLMVLAAVFCLFSSLAFTADVSSLGQMSRLELSARVLLAGGTAAAWLLALARGVRFLPLPIALHLAAVFGVPSEALSRAALDELPVGGLLTRLRFDAVALTTVVMLGYVLFIGFIAGQGRRYLRIQTEIALATEIHQLLVPPIARRVGAFEFFGTSVPSGEVGGDLVDLVEREGTWVAYLADVSGHGVGAGTLMGMFKSAFRSRLTTGASLGAVLTDVNGVMVPLRKPGMFVTGAFLRGRPDGQLAFSLAGHPPILHYRAADRTVVEVAVSNLPVGVFDGQVYDSGTIELARGDVLALASDGLMEVFDRHDREFGLAGLEQLLTANGGQELSGLAATLRAGVRGHGPQLDDQSLLLVRRVT